MCIQTSQEYACTHKKLICLTPCPHALETGSRTTVAEGHSGLSRSGSTVSSITPSIRRNETDTLSSQHRSPLSQPPLYYASAPREQAPSLPPRGSSSNSTPHIGPPPGYPASSTNAASPSRWSIVNPDQPSPVASSVPLTANAASPALPDDEVIITPRYCPYHFPRVLPASNYPCIDCYFLPQWAHLTDRYVNSYAEGHPLNKREDAERISGIGRMRDEFEGKQQGKEVERKERESAGNEGGVKLGIEGDSREGKLNVFLNGDEGAGRAI